MKTQQKYKYLYKVGINTFTCEAVNKTVAVEYFANLMYNLFHEVHPNDTIFINTKKIKKNAKKQ